MFAVVVVLGNKWKESSFFDLLFLGSWAWAVRGMMILVSYFYSFMCIIDEVPYKKGCNNSIIPLWFEKRYCGCRSEFCGLYDFACITLIM